MNVSCGILSFSLYFSQAKTQQNIISLACKYIAVCDVLITSRARKLLSIRLFDIARGLGCPEDRINMMSTSHLLLNKSTDSVLYEILEIWRGMEANNAKLNVLLAVLERNGIKESASKPFII